MNYELEFILFVVVYSSAQLILTSSDSGKPLMNELSTIGDEFEISIWPWGLGRHPK